MSPRASARWGRRQTGPGGLFLCVKHDADVTSCYFHLRRFDVAKGERVAAGQTTPEAVELQSLMRRMLDAGVAAIRTGAPLLCGPEKAIHSATACIVANEALQKNERLKV